MAEEHEAKDTESLFQRQLRPATYPEMWQALRRNLLDSWQVDRWGFVFAQVTGLMNGVRMYLIGIALGGIVEALETGEFKKAYAWLALYAMSELIIPQVELMLERRVRQAKDKLNYFVMCRFMRHYLQMPMAFYDLPGLPGYFHKVAPRRSGGDANPTGLVRHVTSAALRFAGSCVALAFLPWRIALIVGGLVLVVLLLQKGGRAGVSKKERDLSAERERIDSILHRERIPYVRLWGIGDRLVDRYLLLRQELTDLEAGREHPGRRRELLAKLADRTGALLGILVFIQEVRKGKAKARDLLTLLSSFNVIERSFVDFVVMTRHLPSQLKDLVRRERFLALPTESDEGLELPDPPLVIAFENVAFRYPGSTNDVLADVSFSFREGERIALAGLNGAGKSTLLKLLLGILEPTSGRITVNGADLQTIRKSFWRAAFSCLPQDPFHVEGTVRELVMLSDPGGVLNAAQYTWALETSGVAAFLGALHSKDETFVGIDFAPDDKVSVKLSGGQMQMLAIARTLYRKARVYVLDEPTSAMDAPKEERFFAGLAEALPTQSVIFVSHRLSTLRRANRILMVKDGRLVEDGTHAELIAKDGGAYRTQFESQLTPYRE